MARLILIYGGGLAALALLVEWMDFRHATQARARSFYVLCIALLVSPISAALLRNPRFLPAKV